MEPVSSPTIPFYQQFVERLTAVIADVQQDDGIAQQLLHICHMDIYGAACLVVRGGDTTHCLVHCWAPIPAIDDNRLIKVPLAMY